MSRDPTDVVTGWPATAQAIELVDLAATHRFAASIAAALRPGDVIALSGTLGTGKTTLARAILAALGHTGEVPSPSFAIIESYAPPGVALPVVHADFYRLTDPGQVAELGLDDYRQGAALIAEWPENAGGFAHEAACLAITLEMGLDHSEHGGDGTHPRPSGLGEDPDLALGNLSDRNETVGRPRYAIVEAGADWVIRQRWTG